ncbi:hypothetical protein HDU93_009432 [Gonapodya sp. JEL0774]|nr:hypothetical protein HDU93_009432 [Gonapodya sp. JEL0774]
MASLHPSQGYYGLPSAPPSWEPAERVMNPQWEMGRTGGLYDPGNGRPWESAEHEYHHASDGEEDGDSKERRYICGACGKAYRTSSHLAFKGKGTTGPHAHDLYFQFVYVLQGSISFDYKGHGVVNYIPGTCVFQNPGIHHNELRASDDIVLLEVIGPDPFPTRSVGPIDHNDLTEGGPISANGMKFSVRHPAPDGSDFKEDGLR